MNSLEKNPKNETDKVFNKLKDIDFANFENIIQWIKEFYKTKTKKYYSEKIIAIFNSKGFQKEDSVYEYLKGEKNKDNSAKYIIRQVLESLDSYPERGIPQIIDTHIKNLEEKYKN